ncbi:MAG: hypothetical protein R2824_18145 [Saprospiraceae bacterium]|nr:hypothetical protein [Lewinella sp.]
MKMLKTFIVLLCVTTVGTSLQAQSDELLDAIAQETCDCFGKKDVSALSTDQVNMELGMCMMESLGKRPNAMSELKLDYTDQAAMQKFGEQIGTRMLGKCPNLMMKMATAQQGTTEPAAGMQISGTFKGVEGDDFAFLIIEGDDGTSYRLLWLGEFDGADQLEMAKGKPVKVSYQEISCYSPAMKKYLKRKEVKSLEVLK